MSRIRQPRGRDRHHSQGGFTLIEVVVSIALLAIIGGVMGAAYSVGLKAFAKGGTTDRFAGAGDQMVFEQLLGKDVTRASCIQYSGGTQYGSCGAGFANATIATACSGSGTLCVAWPQSIATPPPTCHVAVYTTASNKVRRQEYTAPQSAGIPTSLNSTGVTTDTVSLSVSVQAVTPPSGGANSWVGSLTVAVTNTGVSSGQPTDTLVLHPLASDPAGSAANVTSSGRIC
jgi:prepilin-type N-terminal cleavage/methylation domain-containing protein